MEWKFGLEPCRCWWAPTVSRIMLRAKNSEVSIFRLVLILCNLLGGTQNRKKEEKKAKHFPILLLSFVF